jgi:hypothetical protein
MLQFKITYNLSKWAVKQRQQHVERVVNPVIPLVDTWCRLKAIAGQSGCIKDYKSQLPAILPLLEICKKTLGSRLLEMERLGWISESIINIRLTSWHHIHLINGLKYDTNFFIKPQKIKEEKTTHYWIYLAESEDNKARQAYCISKQVNENHTIKADVYNQLKSMDGIDFQRCETDSKYLSATLFSLYKQSFVSGSAIHDILVKIRPDTSRSVVKMGAVYNDDYYTHIKKLNRATKARYAMQGCYVKKKLKSEMLAFIVPGGTLESDTRQRNTDCHVRYNKHCQTTFTALCDTITARMDNTDPLPADLQAFINEKAPAA